MKYYDYDEQDREIISRFIDMLNDFYPDMYYPIEVDDLEDDEVFFTTQEVLLGATEPYLGTYGSYGHMAVEIREYLSSGENGWNVYELDWGNIARVPDGRYIICSNSWSDSGLFRFYGEQ